MIVLEHAGDKKGKKKITCCLLSQTDRLVINSHLLLKSRGTELEISFINECVNEYSLIVSHSNLLDR